MGHKAYLEACLDCEREEAQAYFNGYLNESVRVAQSDITYHSMLLTQQGNTQTLLDQRLSNLEYVPLAEPVINGHCLAVYDGSDTLNFSCPRSWTWG